MGQQFGDTTLTKVFVGGLAWEMQKEALREHFEKYGEILEAVVISDKISGRSKGYGFVSFRNVTFKEAEAAKRACEDAAPVIDGRRANCNLASLGAKRGGVGIRHSPPSAPAPFTSRGGQQPPPGTEPWTHFPSSGFEYVEVADLVTKMRSLFVYRKGMAVGSRVASPAPPAAQWYYPNPARTPPPPFQLHQYPHGLIPFYSADAYSTNYTNFPNNSKLSPSGGGGGFYQGQFAYPAAAANGMLPMYPLFHWHPHQSQGMALPTAHFFPTSPTAAIPTIISTKPTAIPPPVSDSIWASEDAVEGSSESPSPCLPKEDESSVVKAEPKVSNSSTN
ncbi:hypothetical protein ZIOFF_005113 [Zingiber officinale]|uniref:RRM domain-containing protein n=1 Tax=Zingiber officinale TaxID=94328 RepID=A0A8J5HQM5_ZINOF|nr:hypothetical protein ZIOFF_005113 [Zingiber officinale]